jgi:hypothetical protein
MACFRCSGNGLSIFHLGGRVSPHDRRRDARTLEVSLRGGGSTFGLKKRHDMFRQYSALLANVVLWQPKSKNGLAVASPFRSDCAHFALFERSPFCLI